MTLPLKVRYGRTLLIIIGLMGLSQLLLAMVRTSARQDANPQLILGIVAVMLSGLFFVLFKSSAYLEVTDQSVTLFGVGGFLKKQYPINSLSDLKFVGDKLVYRHNSEWKTIPVTKSIANGADWEALVALLSQRP